MGLSRILRPGQWRKLEQRLCRLARPAWLGTLRRTTPVSSVWGFDRGTPIGRYYIEQFLEQHQRDIHGHVLEVKNSDYSKRYGCGVTQDDILDIDSQNARATIVADLANAQSIQSDAFDCFVLTQTLQYIFKVPDALTHAHRILRPDGILLATVPALRQIDPLSADTDYWRFTAASCAALFGHVFGSEQIAVYAYGNVLTAMAALTGMAAEELSRRELDDHDPRYPMIIAIRAVKRRS